jgi:hypothetical protein
MVYGQRQFLLITVEYELTVTAYWAEGNGNYVYTAVYVITCIVTVHGVLGRGEWKLCLYRSICYHLYCDSTRRTEQGQWKLCLYRSICYHLYCDSTRRT